MLAKMIDKIVSLKETKMAECIAGGIKDTVEAIHRDPDGFFKGGAR